MTRSHAWGSFVGPVQGDGALEGANLDVDIDAEVVGDRVVAVGIRSRPPGPSCALFELAGGSVQGWRGEMASDLQLGPGYGSLEDERFLAKYRARCHCGAVCYEVRADPVDAKVCHCRACQVLHGAPMQWAAIFRKRDVRLVRGIEALRFYNGAVDRPERLLPCKVSCGRCGTLIADEGRRMWLSFPSLFDFGTPPQVPEAFRASCHIFYGMRVMDIEDGLPKWSGHKNESTLL